MKVQEQKVQNNKVVHIYINEDEEKDVDIQEKLKKMKDNIRVVVFVSGNKDPKQTLKAMVKVVQQEKITNN